MIDIKKPANFQEIADALGISKRAAEKRAERGEWKPIAEPSGKNTLRFYALSDLPKEVRKALHNSRIATSASIAIKAQPASTAVAAAGMGFETPTTGISLPTLSESQINDWQREERDARLGVCQAVTALMMKGYRQEPAIRAVIDAATLAGKESHEFKQLIQARDGRGLKNQAGQANFPSVRSIQRWLAAGDLTPRKRAKDMDVPDWADAFLGCYRIPQKPSVDRAYAEFCRHWTGDRPSIHQVRRFLDKLPAIVREKGRMGPRELKNIKPFVVRSFDELWPNDVWSADGHTFDAEVQHPLHGRPFRPEITTIVDIGTRLIVGFSVGLAESSLATVDALRYAITQHGIPAIFYVDNGAGYANELLENAATGLLSRFGITVKHSLPYNSQARGVIERLHRSVWVPAAKTLPSYMGADMDREAKQLNFKLTRTGDKEGVLRMPLSWQGFIRLCEDAISEYNQHAHSSLPKFANADGRRVHFCPADFWAYRAGSIEGYQAVTIDSDVAETLFRPRVERQVNRGQVSLFGNRYFSNSLAMLHDEQVQVAYDIHDPQFAWIYSSDGEFICKAEFNGNAKEYFAKSVVEMSRDKRSDGRMKRLEAAADEIRAEREGGLALEALAVEELPGMRSVVRKLEEKQPVEVAATIPQEDRERYLFWRNLNEQALTGLAVPESLLPFYNSFPNTAIWRSWHGFYSDSTGQERATL